MKKIKNQKKNSRIFPKKQSKNRWVWLVLSHLHPDIFIFSSFDMLARWSWNFKEAIGFQSLFSLSQTCFSLAIPFVIKGFPSLFLPDPKGNPFRFKIWMFPKMGFLIIFTKKDRSNFSNLLFTLIHPLYSFPYWMGVFLGFGYLENPIYISRPGSKGPFQLVLHVQLCGLVVLSKDLSLGSAISQIAEPVGFEIGP